MLPRKERPEVQGLAFLEQRQTAIFVVVGFDVGGARIVGGCVLVLAFVIDGKPAGELQDGPGRPERVGAGLDVGARRVEERRFHLRGHEAVPDQLIEAKLVPAEEGLHALRCVLEKRRPDRLVRFLRGLADLEPPRLFRQGIPAVGPFDVRAHRIERLFGGSRRVGAHVGDQADRARVADLAALVEALGQAHRLGDREAQLPRRVLLELRGDERRRRVLLLLLRLELGDRERHGVGAVRLDLEDQGAGVFAGGLGCSDIPPELAQRAGHLVPRDHVDLLPVLCEELRAELRRLAPPQLRRERPVLSRDERLDRPLPLDDDTEGDALDAPGGQAAAHLVPQQRADLVADEPVEDAPRLLRIDLVGVDLARALERRENRLLRDLVEQHTPKIDVGVLRQFFLQVPADRLSLTVGVGCEEDRVGVLRGLPELGQRLFLLGEGYVGRGEVRFIDAERFLGKIAHVAHRGLDDEPLSQELVDRLGLGRGLDDDERSGHASFLQMNLYDPWAPVRGRAT